MAEYKTKSVGSKYTSSYKVYVTLDDKVVSPFHDIPLYTDESCTYLNAINEIPRFEQAKFEISKSEDFNPIVQDTKKGKPRFVKNVYPFFGYQFNYGAFPQTWENPSKKDVTCNAFGDNDPLDVIEIGTRRKKIGEVYKAKVLGALALLDGGEADWKIVVIDANDEKASEINSVKDVHRVFPQVLSDALTWFRNYKVPDGGKVNEFAMNGEFKGPDFARSIIRECHEEWKGLVQAGCDGISLKNSLHGNPEHLDAKFEVEGCPEPDADIPDSLKVFSFV